jgi:tetratricopeptide (TPR) repeat protein
MTQATVEPTHDKRLALKVGLALAAVTFATYLPVWQHDFINYDDPDYVTRNPMVQHGLTWPGLVWAFGQLHGEATYWHPLTWVSHMVDCQLFGLNPGAHHLVNVLFHTINVVLLFVALRRLTGGLWRSALVAALFAWHPLQVDTVAWVAERKNVLSACFWMLTLLAYARYVERPGWGRYGLVLLCFALGLMAKPVLVTLPCVLLLLDFWPLGRFQNIRLTQAEAAAETAVPVRNSQSPIRNASLRLILEKLPLFALAAASCVVTLLAHRGLGMGQPGAGLALGVRVENALVSYARYVGKTLWPVDLTIVQLHPGVWPAWKVNAAILLLVAVSALVWVQRRRAPYSVVGWLWFLGVLFPFIGVIQVGVQAMAERFVYLPVIGLFITIVWSAAALTAQWQGRQVLQSALGAILAASCVVLTSHQLRHWRNSVTLFTQAVAVDPKNFIAHNNLALALGLEGKWDEALRHAQESVRHNPNTAEPHNLAGMILDQQQKPAEAIEHYRAAVRLRPNWELAQLNLARDLARLGKFPEAIEHYFMAVRLAPREALARAELAQLLAAEQRTAEAIAQYRAALQVWPDWPETLNNLAWLLATHPRAEFRNGPEAVRLAERACELTHRQQPLFLGTLAAAYAEGGRFDDAIRTSKEAQTKAQAAGLAELAARNERLAKTYELHRPLREGSPTPAETKP